MDTSCYYTFSTIAQTLAGAFGFLVAVVMYQLQARAPDLERSRDNVSKFWRVSDNGALQAAIRVQIWSTIRELYQKSESKFAPGTQSADSAAVQMQARQAFRDDVDALLSIKADLKRSLTLTGITIGASLALLMLTPLFSNWSRIAGLLWLVDVVAACVCLWTYYPLVNTLTN